MKMNHLVGSSVEEEVRKRERKGKKRRCQFRSRRRRQRFRELEQTLIPLNSISELNRSRMKKSQSKEKREEKRERDEKTHVLRELVMEVVVTFSDRNKSSDPMVARSMLVIERSLSKPMSERVDAESRVVNEEESSGTGEEESSTVIVPSESSDQGREDESHTDDEVNVPLVLPSDYFRV